jgi:hypothetical protein
MWNIDDKMISLAAASSKNPKELLGGNISLLQFPPHHCCTTHTPYGLPIVAVPTVGFWLIVVCEPALRSAAAMLAAKYQN